MTVRGLEKLHSLLNAEGRELVNIKFIPGTDRGLTPEQLAEAAHTALSAALAGNLVDAPPLSGRVKSSI